MEKFYCDIMPQLLAFYTGQIVAQAIMPERQDYLFGKNFEQPRYFLP